MPILGDFPDRPRPSSRWFLSFQLLAITPGFFESRARGSRRFCFYDGPVDLTPLLSSTLSPFSPAGKVPPFSCQYFGPGLSSSQRLHLRRCPPSYDLRARAYRSDRLRPVATLPQQTLFRESRLLFRRRRHCDLELGFFPCLQHALLNLRRFELPASLRSSPSSPVYAFFLQGLIPLRRF